MTQVTAVFAKEVGDTASARLVGVIDPATLIAIISGLLPVVVNLFKGCQASNQVPQNTDPRAYLEDYYDESDNTFDEHLIARVRPHTRRTARKQGVRHLTPAQVDVITKEMLDKSMHASDATVSMILMESN